MMKAMSGSSPANWKTLRRPGDVLVVISASGNSPNLVRAVELARARGVTTIGFLGFDGGVLKQQVDECVWLPTAKGAYELARGRSHHPVPCALPYTDDQPDPGPTCCGGCTIREERMRQGEQPGKPSSRPTQAVILAGGRGTRLRPLTDTRPKPMVEILGKPFLEYQVEQLRDQGFKRILLLLGYLPEVVQDYFT